MRKRRSRWATRHGMVWRAEECVSYDSSHGWPWLARPFDGSCFVYALPGENGGSRETFDTTSPEWLCALKARLKQTLSRRDYLGALNFVNRFRERGTDDARSDTVRDYDRDLIRSR